MTPKEKAEELVYKFAHAKSQYGFINTNKHRTKECAIISVDEILQANKVWYENSIPYKYWQEVKQEIEKL